MTLTGQLQALCEIICIVFCVSAEPYEKWDCAPQTEINVERLQALSHVLLVKRRTTVNIQMLFVCLQQLQKERRQACPLLVCFSAASARPGQTQVAAASSRSPVRGRDSYSCLLLLFSDCSQGTGSEVDQPGQEWVPRWDGVGWQCCRQPLYPL